MGWGPFFFTRTFMKKLILTVVLCFFQRQIVFRYSQNKFSFPISCVGALSHRCALARSGSELLDPSSVTHSALHTFIVTHSALYLKSQGRYRKTTGSKSCFIFDFAQENIKKFFFGGGAKFFRKVLQSPNFFFC